MFYSFTGILAFAVTLDVSVIVRGGVSGGDRLSRHLWRVCAALLLAAFSFFLGQQKVFPLALRGSPILLLPEVAVLGTMIFWLVRVRLRSGSQFIKPREQRSGRTPDGMPLDA